MYLTMLNNEQKNLFLNIAEKIACVDGGFSTDEKRVIEGYYHEMSVAGVKVLNNTLEEMTERLKVISNAVERRIIIFEFVGLAMVDLNFDENERNVLKNMAEKFNITSDYVNECEKLLKKYITFQNEINTLVVG